MARRVPVVIGEYYHVYNRGVDKRDIFLSATDYERFTTLLYACNGTRHVDLDEQGKSIASLLERKINRGEPLVDICAYALMPNHFHIFAREIREGGIAKFMQKLSIAYTGYFNKKNKRSGSLFQGTYQARHASKDPYCSYIASYIHLNPIKLIDPKWKENGIKDRAGAERLLREYVFTSYLDYAGTNRLMGLILNKSALPSECTSAGDFQAETATWLTNHRKS